ncbi:MAG: 50S ribosomal protein L15 [Patescibacteria group bacterium]|jgi:large subunit ribosomal protein L15
MLQVHTIKPAKGAKHRFKYIGRGNASGHGTSSTRGGKGQTARSGGRRGLAQKGFRRLMQSAPKLRGFTSLNTRPIEVNLNELERYYSAGETVNLQTLQAKGILGSNDAAAKIILRGELKKKLIVAVACTKGAAEKIIAAGGEVKA